MLTISKVIMNREKYYPYSMLCPFCGAQLRFIKNIRTVLCDYCNFHDTAVNSKNRVS